MKKKLLVWLMVCCAGLPYLLHANLPVENEKKCKCVDGKIIEFPKNQCVDLKIPFGRAANENEIDLQGFFQIFAIKPTPTIYTPQGLMYHNYLTNNIYKNYKNAKRLIEHQEDIGNGVNLIYYTDEFGNRYDESSVSKDLSYNIVRYVKIFTSNRELLEFKFIDGEGSAKLSGAQTGLNYLMVMKGINDEIVLDNPAFLDMYFGNGNSIRYSASTGNVISFRTSTGREVSSSTPSVGLEAIWDEDGTIQQVFSNADGLADIVSLTPGIKYEIRFYDSVSIGEKISGKYTTSGAPHSIWRVENPVPGQTTQLLITKIVGDSSREYKYQFNHAANDWILYYPDNLAVVSKNSIWDYSKTVKTETITEKNITGELAYKQINVIQKFPFGDRIVTSTIDPDGTNQRTIFSYTDDGRIASFQRYNGYWERYLYDGQGRKIKQIFPWKNSSFDTTEPETDTIAFDYTPVVETDHLVFNDERPRQIVRKVCGTTVLKTFLAYYKSAGSYYEVEENCIKGNAQYGNQENYRTVKKYYSSASDEISRGRLESVCHPDGKMESYSYENGNYDITSSVFTPGNGAALRVTVTSGTMVSPAGISNKTTQKRLVYDLKGNIVREEQFVYTGSGHELISFVEFEYNRENKLLQKKYSNGTAEKYTWNCCNKESFVDIYGNLFAYTYDDLNRLILERKVGLQNVINDLITSYAYDAKGRIVSKTLSGDDVVLSEFFQFDLAGQLKKKTHTNGTETSYVYLNGVCSGAKAKGNTIIKTLPGGATHIVENYCDGRERSITGTAQTPTYTDYGVNDDGSIWTLIHSGGEDAPYWQKITRNMVGKITKEEKSGYNNSTILITYSYNGKGLLEKKSQTGLADYIYEYDDLGNISSSGLDVDRNGVLDAVSMDRIEKNYNYFLKYDNSWWEIESLYVLGMVNNQQEILAKKIETRLSDWTERTVSERRETDINGNVTISQIKVIPEERKELTTIKASFSTIAAEELFLNGLKVSDKTSDGSITSYSYDSIGRLNQINEPRVGIRTRTYYSSGVGRIGQLQSEIAANNSVMTIDYHQDTGKQKSITNNLGNSIFFSYNSFGKITKKWGATYPIEYIYNSMGWLVQTKTYRNWGNGDTDIWPEGLSGADSTFYEYDNSSGLVVAEIDSSQKEVRFSYNGYGKIASKTLARKDNLNNNIVTTYGYSSETGELLFQEYSDDTADISYTYTRTGQYNTISDEVGIRTFGYDSKFNEISQSISGIYNKTLNFSYSNNPNGIMGRFQGISGHFSYEFDDLGRISKIIGENGNNITYSRNSQKDLITRIERTNNVNTNIIYQASRDNITRVSNVVNNTILSQYDYSYDSIDRRTAINRNGSVFPGEDILNVGYNFRNELTSIVSSNNNDFSFQYEFDSLGNRLSSTRSGIFSAYSTNSLNQYLSIQNGQNNIDLAYDADGNNLFDGEWTYTWDAENRLRKAMNSSMAIEFKYDYLGRRISKKIINNSNQIIKHNYYIYDKFKLIEEIDALNNNASLLRYVWQPSEMGNEVPVMVFVPSSNKNYYYHCDASKNITEITDENANIVAHYEYGGFGETLVASGSFAILNPFRFSSEYYDQETGLTNYTFRYYNSKTGKWLSRDPLGMSGGVNLYAFVANNPVMIHDVYGLMCRTVRTTKSFPFSIPPYLSFSYTVSVSEKTCPKCCDDETPGKDVEMTVQGTFSATYSVPLPLPPAISLALTLTLDFQVGISTSSVNKSSTCTAVVTTHGCSTKSVSVGFTLTPSKPLKYLGVKAYAKGRGVYSCKSCDGQAEVCKSSSDLRFGASVGSFSTEIAIDLL